MTRPGAYFGAKKANESLHALYAYDNGTVTLDNLGGADESGLSVEAKVYDTSGKVLDDQTANGINLGAQGVKNSVLTPKVPAATTAPAKAQTYFVELLLRQHGQVVDRNVYWRSTQDDVVDWTKTLGNPQATMSQYADLQGLQNAGARQPEGGRHDQSPARPERRRHGDQGDHHQHLEDPRGRLLPARRRPQGQRRRQPLSGDNQVVPVAVERQRRHALAGRIGDPVRHLRIARPRRRTPVVSVSGLEHRHHRRCRTPGVKE